MFIICWEDKIGYDGFISLCFAYLIWVLTFIMLQNIKTIVCHSAL